MRDIQNSFVYGRYFRQIVFHVMQLQDELLAPYNITSQQARTLGFIYLMREQRGAVCQKDLEEYFGLSGSSVTSLLKGLEGKGYIRRQASREDGRAKLLSLTDEGKKLHDAFMEKLEESEGKIVAGMTQNERSTLLELLKKAADNIR